MCSNLCCEAEAERQRLRGGSGATGCASADSSAAGEGGEPREPMAPQPSGQIAAFTGDWAELVVALEDFPNGFMEPPSLHLLQRYRERLVPPACAMAAALQECWQRPEQLEADRLELAHAAATRSCAYLRCANLDGGSGRAKKCSACKAPYCGTACSHADWREGHMRVCKVLAAERQAAAGEGGQ